MRFSLRAAAAAILPLAAALPAIHRNGKFLYDDSGARFYLKGVAYQPQGELAASTEANEANGGFPEPSSFIDPLASEANCTRDIPYLQQLGVNAVRVYSVNSSLNHDACMHAFDAAGIYVLLDVSLPLNGSINRAAPSWSTNLLNEYIRTIDAFNGYPNVLAYNIGNEVISTPDNTYSAPFVKAAARDTKAYLKSIGSSALVGYSATDGEPDFRNAVAHYFTCGNDTVTVDLYGLNNYQWCGDSNLTGSNWNAITEGFKDIPVVTIMSEFGCITAPPRLWTEVPALLSAPVSDVFSGGIAFSYFPTSDGYGMVTFSGDGTKVTLSDDFNRLAAQYKNSTGPNAPARDTAAAAAIECPGESNNLLASPNLPPTPDQKACECINTAALSCRVTTETANDPIKVGALIDTACSLLGETNSTVTCANIGGNGTTGQYGPLGMCEPSIKLSYVMTAYYEQFPVATSCDFNGNATLYETGAQTASDASEAAASCLAGKPPVSTPTGSSATVPPGNGGSNPGGSSNSPSSPGSGAVSLTSGPLIGAVIGAVGIVLGAFHILI